MGPFFLLIVSLFHFLFLSLLPAAESLSIQGFRGVRTQPAGAGLENACQCSCCYTVGAVVAGAAECVPAIDTSFDTVQCSLCSVESCAAAFPMTCGQESSVVSTDCIKRKGWVLRLVPVLFISMSVGLVVYGVFFKRFDGYHDESGSRRGGFGTFSRPDVSVSGLGAAGLAPIYENAEVGGGEEDERRGVTV